MVDKLVDTTWHKGVQKNETYTFSKDADIFPMHHTSKAHQRLTNHIFTGMMAFVMGIVTMIRFTSNMPKKLTEAMLYSSQIYDADTMIKGPPNVHKLLPEPIVSSTEYMSILKKMADLEDKVSVLSLKTPAMPPEKEELLNAAMSRIYSLEQELSATKKALEDALARQQELLAYIDKKKKKKKFNPFCWR